MPGVVSDSVEGVWQGLKRIRGAIDTGCFAGRGRKRGGVPEGHSYAGEVLAYVEARRLIYIPTYEWTLEHRISPALVGDLLRRADMSIEHHVHDVADVGQADDTSGPLAHAAVLVRWLNRVYGDAVLKRCYVDAHRVAVQKGWRLRAPGLDLTLAALELRDAAVGLARELRETGGPSEPAPMLVAGVAEAVSDLALAVAVDVDDSDAMRSVLRRVARMRAHQIVGPVAKGWIDLGEALLCLAKALGHEGGSQELHRTHNRLRDDSTRAKPGGPYVRMLWQLFGRMISE